MPCKYRQHKRFVKSDPLAWIEKALGQPEIANVTVSLRIEKRDGTSERFSEVPQDVTPPETTAQQLRDKETELQDANRRLNARETELQDANRRLNARETELRDANRRLNARETELQDANGRLRDKEAKLDAARAKLSPFTRLLSVFEAYRAVPDSQSADAKQIISASDPVIFLSAAGDFKHILRYWDAVRGECETADEETRETLAHTLAFLLDCHNAILSAPAYALMSPENDAGKPYDRERQQQSETCSHGQGVVEKVLLPGIWNLVRNAPERKSVVYYR